jgi:ribosomal protein S15P/S13E
MKPADTDFINQFSSEKIKQNSDPEAITRFLEIINDLQDEVKRLKRNQGLDIVKGKRQKPLNYIPGKDKI